MAGRNKGSSRQKAKARGRHRKLAASLLALAGLALLGFFGWMALEAHLVHLCHADVYLEDLPRAFDGSTVLYISDWNIGSASDVSASVRLMRKLAQLQPDLLILGGDYALAGAEDHAQAFLSQLSDFPVRLGKFAVMGEVDAGSAAALKTIFQDSGVQLLVDTCATVEQSGAQLIIAGLNDSSQGSTPYSEIGRYFSGDECVLAIAHNPSAYVGIRVAEARDGGAWADLVLAGHNLGGQLQLFGRTIHTMPEEESRCLAGWYYADDLPMLVSQGVGCKSPKLRLGTQSEAWLLTLHCPETLVLPDF